MKSSTIKLISSLQPQYFTRQIMQNPYLMVPVRGPEEDEFPRRDERVLQWTQQETRDFIAIRADLEKDFSVSKRNKTLWEVVSAKMRERGYKRSPDQCKCKWKNLLIRYKGKETTDPDNGRPCPFFEELHAVFTEREKRMQQLLLESEAGSVQSKKRGKKNSVDPSSEEFSEDEDENEYESDEERISKTSNPRKRKTEKEKYMQTSTLEKPPRQPNVGTRNGDSSVQEILQIFFQQQQMIDLQWRESMDKHAFERQLFEQEWRQSMVKLERERIMIEETWREREKARQMREETRAEKRDALLTAVLNQLIRENEL